MEKGKPRPKVLHTPETKRVLRIIELLQVLKLIKNEKAFCEAVGWQNQNLTSVKKEERNFPNGKLVDIERVFHIKHAYLKAGILPVFKEDSEHFRLNQEITKNDYLLNLLQGNNNQQQASENTLKDEPRKIRSNAKYIGDLEDIEDPEGNTNFREISPGTYRMKIHMVPERAKAGFLLGFQDPEYIEELPWTEVTVNFFHKGKYLAFEVDGDSMFDGTIDSIPHKTIVTGREIKRELWQYPLHSHEWPNWVFVHKREGILVKRIAKQDLNTGIITLHSLNQSKDSLGNLLYPDQDIHMDDLLAIYNVVKRELPN